VVERTAREASEFLSDASFIWHQRFRLAGDVYTPGSNDIEWLARTSGLPQDLTGKTVLDLGTTNGGAAFEAERRGARRVFATDIVPAAWFGFDRLHDFLRSKVEFRKISIYELDSVLNEQFDIVIFWGVLYHLRHPLLGIDNVRGVTRELLLLETAVADHDLDHDVRVLPLARFYRRDELDGDASNWFEPTVATVLDWCFSSGLIPELVAAWPESAPSRCVVAAKPVASEPEFSQLSYERALRCTVAVNPSTDGRAGGAAREQD
jgi:tRNA (mo5U34)-methyltransferase